jgi:hypothetical protein
MKDFDAVKYTHLIVFIKVNNCTPLKIVARDM